jgi:endonuclease G
MIAFAAAALAAQPFPSLAAATSCPQHFAAGQAPDILREALRTKSAEICMEAFAVTHSGLSRTALWSAERLTKASIASGQRVDRVDDFHEEDALPAADRASLSDYRGSGYDRGHLAPAADMPTETAQQESFSLVNMVPQDPGTNRGVWAGVEAEIRKLATTYGEVYVVTGPVFSGAKLKSLKGRVAVPTHVFKAVYIPAAGAASAYVATNDGTAAVSVLSVAALSSMISIDPFPGVPAATKAAAVSLPMPKPGRAGRAPTAARTEASGLDMGDMGTAAKAAAAAAFKAWRAN